jgi:hypothetical protein
LLSAAASASSIDTGAAATTATRRQRQNSYCQQSAECTHVFSFLIGPFLSPNVFANREIIAQNAV